MTSIGKNFLDHFMNTGNPQTPSTDEDKNINTETPSNEGNPQPEENPTPTPVAISQEDNNKSSEPNSTPPENNNKPNPQSQPEPEPDYNDEKVIAYFKSKGKEITSIDDLFKEPEKPSDSDPVNPFEGMSEEVQQFLKYHQETGRDLNDWNSLSKDYSKLSPIDMAREKAMAISGGKLNIKEVDEYLERKLNIDLSDISEPDKFRDIELEGFAKDYLESKIKDQEKFKKPIDKPTGPEMVTLQNGAKMPKEEYDRIQNQRQSYLQAIKQSADNITETKITVKVDDNGTERAYDLDYQYSKDDLHNMISSASDIDQTVSKLFGNKDGFSHKNFAESMFWLDPTNREKAINAIVHKALAQRTEEFMRQEQNTNFDRPRIPSGNNNQKTVQIPGSKSIGYGVKYDF